MPGHDILVIGASMGGLDALRELLPGLQRDTPAALFIVWHIAAESLGLLPDLLRPVSPLPVDNARDGDPIQPGRILVAPPDHHLLIERGHVRLARGPKENRFRPAIDPLFRSAAAAYGPRVVGVVLSGALDDGTAGLWAIKDCGGVAVAQDPLDAIQPSMPRSATQHVAVDHVLPARALGPLLDELARSPVEHDGAAPVADQLKIETRIALEQNALESGVMQLGTLSPFTCPECHGTLLQITDGGPLRFRCHTGHAYTAASLLAEVGGAIEESLWSAIRVIEERIMLLHHLAAHMQQSDDPASAEQFLAQAREAEQQVQLVRLALLRHSTRAPGQPTADPGAARP